MTELYTKEILLALNSSYNNDHRLSEFDVITANIFKVAVERSRSQLGHPKCGDMVIVNGQYAHIEEVENGEVYICENAYVPFISCKFYDSNPKVSTNTSGGPWRTVEIDQLIDTKVKKMKQFCFFGHCGMTANGAVTFSEAVNVFKLKE